MTYTFDAWAARCRPTWHGKWTATQNCDFPHGVKVYGDMDIWDKVIRVPTGSTMWFDLTNNKITFTTGRIEFEWTANMDTTGSVSARDYESVSYSVGNGNTITACPAWTYAFYHISPTIPTTPGSHYIIDQTATNSPNSSKTSTQIHNGVTASSTMYCGAR